MNPIAKPQPADFRHWVEIPTRWSDLDLLGHVNNTRFFTFDEDARLAYFQALWRDDPKFWKEYGFILARIGADFVSQLHHPAQVRVGLRIARIGRSSLETLAGMFEGERLVAVTRATVVWFDYVNQKPLPVPEAVRAAIRARESIAPEE